MNKMLVVIDMINGFINEGPLHDESISRIVPNIIEKINQAKQNGDTVVFFRDSHNPTDEEFKTYPPHCLKGSRESEIIDELKPYLDGAVIIEKTTTNGFKTPEFQALIASKHWDEVEATGCCSDICVTDFSNSLLEYLHQHNLDTKLTVAENCIDTFHGPEHDPDFINKVTLATLEDKGADVLRNFDANGFRVRKCRSLTHEKFLNMKYVEYETLDGKTIKYTLATRKNIAKCVAPTLNPDAVTVLPYSYVNGELIVYLTHEFRYPVGDYIYSLPSGLVDPGETSQQAAIREAKEETGASVVKIQRVSSNSYSSAGMTDETSESFEAEVNMDGKQDLGEGEVISVVPTRFCELEKLLNNPEIKWENRAKLQLVGFVEKKNLEQQIADKDAQIEELKAKLALYENPEKE